jgi:hypothetical protein
MANRETKVKAFREALEIVVPENQKLRESGLRVFESVLDEPSEDEDALFEALDFICAGDWSKWQAGKDLYHSNIDRAELSNAV